MPPTTVVDRAVDRYVLEGRIVTMDDRFTVLDAGRIYVDGRDIAAVTGRGGARARRLGRRARRAHRRHDLPRG